MKRFELSGRVAIVTGDTRSLGRAMAEGLQSVNLKGPLLASDASSFVTGTVLLVHGGVS